MEYGLPVIGIGNLLVGGSGKTPMAIALASHYQKSAVVLRGYGRKSRGLVVVSEWGRVLTDIETSGDEAMLLAKSLPASTVIVSENRHAAIQKAASMGAGIVFLDDAFGKVDIKKFDILLHPARVVNPFPLPSGPFREFPFEKRRADLVLIEGRDFRRRVVCEGCDRTLMLVTAIANPARLEPYLPKGLVKCRMILPDHAWFDEKKIVEKMRHCGVDRIVTTEKDVVKMEGFRIDTAILKLTLDVDKKVFEAIDKYLKNRS